MGITRYEWPGGVRLGKARLPTLRHIATAEPLALENTERVFDVIQLISPDCSRRPAWPVDVVASAPRGRSLGPSREHIPPNPAVNKLGPLLLVLLLAGIQPGNASAAETPDDLARRAGEKYLSGDYAGAMDDLDQAIVLRSNLERFKP